MTECRIAWSPGEAWIAICDGDLLIDFALWRPGSPDGFGDRHLVRVRSCMPALGGAFVTLGDGTDGFLTGTHQEGTLVRARVTRSPQNGKGLRLKPAGDPHSIADSGDSGPRLLAPGPSPLEEIATRFPDVPLCHDNPALIPHIPTPLRSRLKRVPRAIDDVLAAECAELMTPEAMLAHGIRATFTPTPALIAIDLDDPEPDRRGHVDTFTANRDSFVPLAREIRMRNLSGALFVDPAGIPQRKRAALVPFLGKALASDPMQARILGATSLGLLELVRTRGRPPLHELVRSPIGIGLAALRQILNGHERHRSGRTPRLAASLAVCHALEKDPCALDAFALAFGARLMLDMEPGFPDRYWRFTP
ncbi:ribonuclease E/G [Swaminathania salitolerans]|uniref:RNA-binding protein AU-1/Ribonuclease E/G domain-containing protein n=1 Tax=Swaminathania salitolerans TaxID=182838 RepID=A0A511BSN4_9PROT|nr:ribonuclease E/G [Swaminathania salitolerans]GBQ13116.1 hypothetical protein AA21291_1399 [Swaminathania salitolerans LMG 21291]GEL03339.1 hypothetical protein SSA02_25020 [Swaminathania salitolerans]